MFSGKLLQRVCLNFVCLQYICSPTTLRYRLYPKNSLKLEKQFLIFCLSRNVAAKPTDQSCSNSISAVPQQIFPVSLSLFFFRRTLKRKGSSHQKKIKKFCFLKNSFNDFHKLLWIYSTFESQQYVTIGYSRKILQTKKKLRIPLQIFRAYFFLFRPTIKIKGNLLKKQANELSDKHGILHTCSILFLLLCY